MENKEDEILSINFTDACRTGIGLIDAEHEHLFELMNQVLDSLRREGVKAIDLEEYLSLLRAYGQTHFAHEEEYMESIGDPELVHQRLAHRSFINKVDAVDLHGLDDVEKERLVKHLLQYNVEWLYRHILYSDILIGKMVHRADAAVQVMTEQGEVYIYCPFEDRLITGNEQLDELHREWFELLNEAYTLLENNYQEEEYDHEMHILDMLEERLSDGFALEEELMVQQGYPWALRQEHCRAHSSCLDRLSEKDMAESAPDQKEQIEEMLDFLYAGMTNHILRLDKLMVEKLKLA